MHTQPLPSWLRTPNAIGPALAPSHTCCRLPGLSLLSGLLVEAGADGRAQWPQEAGRHHQRRHLLVLGAAVCLACHLAGALLLTACMCPGRCFLRRPCKVLAPPDWGGPWPGGVGCHAGWAAPEGTRPAGVWAWAPTRLSPTHARPCFLGLQHLPGVSLVPGWQHVGSWEAPARYYALRSLLAPLQQLVPLPGTVPWVEPCVGQAALHAFATVLWLWLQV